jgi:hypothetical protein
MDYTGIIVAIITAVSSVVAVIITNIASNRKMQQQLEVSQAVTNTKIENLTQEVRRHNDFAQRVPVLEEKIAVANHRIDDLEREKSHEH